MSATQKLRRTGNIKNKSQRNCSISDIRIRPCLTNFLYSLWRIHFEVKLGRLYFYKILQSIFYRMSLLSNYFRLIVSRLSSELYKIKSIHLIGDFRPHYPILLTSSMYSDKSKRRESSSTLESRLLSYDDRFGWPTNHQLIS